MVRSGLQGVRGPLGAVASIDRGVLSIANGSMLRSCEYDQQRVNMYEEFIYICTVHVELRNKPHIIHHAPSEDENTRQVSDYAHQQRNSKHLTQHVSRLLYSSQQAKPAG